MSLNDFIGIICFFIFVFVVSLIIYAWRRKPCPFCKQAVDPNALICPHCRTHLSKAINLTPNNIYQQKSQQEKIRIAKNGVDIGDIEIDQVRQFLQTGQLQPTDYYFDFVQNKWLQISSHVGI